MAPKFARWVDDLTCAVDVGQGGSKQVLRVPFGGSPCGTGALAEAKAGQGWGREQSEGGGGAQHELARYQKAYIVGERGFMRGGDGNEEQRAQQAARASEARQSLREAAEQEISRVLGVIAAEGAAGREGPRTWGSKVCWRILDVASADHQATASDEQSETGGQEAGGASGGAALDQGQHRQPNAARAGREGAREPLGAGHARARAASDACDVSGDAEGGPGQERVSDPAQQQYKRLARLIHPEEGGRGVAGAAEAFAAVRAAVDTLRELAALPRYLGVAVDPAETETLLLPWLRSALAAAGAGGGGRDGASERRAGDVGEEGGDAMCALASLAGQRVEDRWRLLQGGGADGQGYHVTLWHGAEHGLQAFDTAMAALQSAPVGTCQTRP